MGDINDHLGYVLNRDKTPPRRTFSGGQAATVVSATASSIRFTIDAYSPDWAFDGARWQPVPGAGLPPAGTQCLVIFAHDDMDQPWVVAFANWPAA
jgi:hypothetical protein